MEHDEGISNHSGNRPFEDVLEVNMQRRKVLAGGLAGAAMGFFSAPALAGMKGWGQDRHDAARHGGRRPSRLLGFAPVPVAEGSGPWPAISSDYEYQVLIPGGEPLEPGGPAYQWPPTAADQARQIGIGHDGMWFFPIEDKGCRDDDDRAHWGRHKDIWRGGENRHGMLAINHEYGDNMHVFGKSAPESLEDVRVSQHAHGVSVVEIQKKGRTWRAVESDNARRIHVNTPVAFSGPVAGHALLATPNGNIPLGTANNCANGHTPWGTYLTCEENFNGYFGASGAWSATEAQKRYGFSAGGFGYGWHLFDRRFDLSDEDYRNEEHRFGWVVEIDPFDATQTPVKRTALGRFKHEGVAITERRGKRVTFFCPAQDKRDIRWRTSTSIPGIKFSSTRRMVSAPKSKVSDKPRALRMRSVKTWPRSGSAASCTSSMAKNSTRRSIGIASTVHIKYRALGGVIFSSPVISATLSWPRRATARS